MRRQADLHIDKLVLRGLSPAARERIGPALAAELSRLIEAHGLPRALAEAGRVLRLGDLSHAAAAGAPAAGLGTHLGAALHRQLAPEAPAAPSPKTAAAAGSSGAPAPPATPATPRR